ncbi:hypothetical protein MNV49_004651 [Pseudohyphozyma bogoriensis]|nr:hypothetical protein MNV49_004651 [Pseudohyphozyma bogoriensis]
MGAISCGFLAFVAFHHLCQHRRRAPEIVFMSERRGYPYPFSPISPYPPSRRDSHESLSLHLDDAKGSVSPDLNAVGGFHRAPPAGMRRQKINELFAALVVGLSIGVALVIGVEHARVPKPVPGPVCDPFKHGFLQSTDEWGTGYTYTSVTPCQPHHWTAHLVAPTTLPWIQNKTMLMLGDSIMQKLMLESCKRTGGVVGVFPSPPEMRNYTATGVDDPRLKRDPLGLECWWKQHNFTVGLGFVFGVTDYNSADSDPLARRAALDPDAFPLFMPNDSSAPYSFEQRYVQAHDLWMLHHGAEPTLVLTNSGAWDLKAMFFNDVYFNENHPYIPVSLLESYQHRSRQSLELLHDLFPNSHHARLGLHLMTAVDAKVQKAWYPKAIVRPGDEPALTGRIKPTVHTIPRMTQLQAAYMEEASLGGVTVLDTKELFDGLQNEIWLRDEVHPSVGANVWMWEYLLETLWRVTGNRDPEKEQVVASAPVKTKAPTRSEGAVMVPDA